MLRRVTSEGSSNFFQIFEPHLERSSTSFKKRQNKLKALWVFVLTSSGDPVENFH